MTDTREKLILQCSPHIQNIGTELISLTPEYWKSFYVRAEVTSAPEDLESVEVVIRSNEGYGDIVFPSDALTEPIFRILDEFKNQFRIKVFRCDVFEKDGGGWGSKTDFKYFDPAAPKS